MKYIIAMLLASSAFAFTPPTDITSLLPANNQVTVTAKTSVIPNVDQYTVSDTVVAVDSFGNCESVLSAELTLTSCTYSVSAGTAESQADILASANQAWAKLKAESLTAAQAVNPTQLQTAMIWFMNNVYVPYYRK
jgi:hypothetical protein